MTTRVAFLRAVNVGRRRVANARLIEILEGLGYDDVWTFVNSGNAVFDATGARAVLERAIRTGLEADVGFEVTTFVRSAAELRSALDRRPFDVGPGDTYFLTFLQDRPSAAQRHELEALSNEMDTLVVDGRDVHWLMHGTSTESTLVKRQWERILGPESSTSRNTTMLTRLLAKIDER
jgi:uncharacterized protein (DUF1697 family)